MFRNVFEAGSNQIDTQIYPTIVVGSGISGLYTALKIAQAGVKLAFVTKSKLGESNTRYAQGGVAVVLPENTNDSIELHVEDTLNAGAGLSNPYVTRFITERGAQVVNELIKYGVQFDRCNDNKLAMTLEGAHSVRRVLHSGGDATGKNIEQTLVDLITKNSNIDVFEEHQVVELLVDANKNCAGVIILDINNNVHKVFISESTVLATGGLSQVYLNTTNPEVATGDGVALAFRAGAVVQDMEFIQFHPTAFHTESTPKFLISESVRGEGAMLRNIKGELFAHRYDQRADLAPRDIVTRAIFNEMCFTDSDYVYLDATELDESVLNNRFPNIIRVCKNDNIDITKDYIPVSPAAHYSMGGIKVNVYGQTSIKHLYSVGEAACTSLHGANRLASNSLLECLVLAEQVTRDILAKNEDISERINLEALATDSEVTNTIKQYFNTQEILPLPNVNKMIVSLQSMMWQNAGIKRTAKSLIDCYKFIIELEKNCNRNSFCLTQKEYELRNLLIIAALIAKAALNRTESRGAHFREDFPLTNETAFHSFIIKDEDSNIYELPTSQDSYKRLCELYS